MCSPTTRRAWVVAAAPAILKRELSVRFDGGLVNDLDDERPADPVEPPAAPPPVDPRTETVVVRTRAGAFTHKAYKRSSATFCGARVARHLPAGTAVTCAHCGGMW